VVLRDEDILNKKEDTTDEPSSAIAVSEAVAAGDGETADTNDVEDDDTDENKTIEGVFVARDGRAVFVPVVTGIADQQNIEIVSGLERGDHIITGPFRTLRTLDDGDRIEIKKDKQKKRKGKA